MSVRSIEAEVSIKSGVQAECTIGREVVVEIHDGVNLEALTATENGSYRPASGVDGWDRVTVSVPERQPITEPLSVTENGQYTPAEGVDGFSGVTVAVPERIPVTETLSVTENGLYEPTEGVDGYDRVVVDVPPTIPDIEPLTVTANGVYTASGDGFNPVTVNVPIQKDPNVYEGEFEGTETGVLTIDTGYEGDSFPKAVIIRPVSGIMQTDDDFYQNALRYAINLIVYFKANTTAPSYSSEPSGAENQVRYIGVRKSTLTEYGNAQTASAYIYTTASNEGVYNIDSAVRIPDNHTLKVVVTATQNTAFMAGIRYKYQVFY